jgi:hypothetical protein
MLEFVISSIWMSGGIRHRFCHIAAQNSMKSGGIGGFRGEVPPSSVGAAAPREIVNDSV